TTLDRTGKEIIRFLHGDKLTITGDNVIEMLKRAEEWGVTAVVKKCQELFPGVEKVDDVAQFCVDELVKKRFISRNDFHLRVLRSLGKGIKSIKIVSNHNDRAFELIVRQLTELEQLHVKGTLSSRRVKVITGLTNLKHLKVEAMHSDADCRLLAELPKLETLRFLGCHFTDDAFDALPKMTMLKIKLCGRIKGKTVPIPENTLLLERCYRLQDVVMERLEGAELERLAVTDCHRISSEAFKRLAKCQLKTLDISSTQIENDVIEELGKMSLEKLTFANCRHITDVRALETSSIAIINHSGCILQRNCACRDKHPRGC
ncbi:MAG: hypothetical protein KDK65_02140, partial [Chlamydiia bacterium]|nr:hypothetical protein [Chlamydiia bacterium]